MSDELLTCECKDVDGAHLHRDVNSYGACQVWCDNCGRSGPFSIEINGSRKDCNEEEAIMKWKALSQALARIEELEKMFLDAMDLLDDVLPYKSDWLREHHGNDEEYDRLRLYRAALTEEPQP